MFPNVANLKLATTFGYQVYTNRLEEDLQLSTLFAQVGIWKRLERLRLLIQYTCDITEILNGILELPMTSMYFS